MPVLFVIIFSQNFHPLIMNNTNSSPSKNDNSKKILSTNETSTFDEQEFNTLKSTLISMQLNHRQLEKEIEKVNEIKLNQEFLMKEIHHELNDYTDNLEKWKSGEHKIGKDDMEESEKKKRIDYVVENISNKIFKQLSLKNDFEKNIKNISKKLADLKSLYNKENHTINHLMNRIKNKKKYFQQRPHPFE